MVSIGKHSWETSNWGHDWERDDDSDDEPDPETNPRAAAMQFLDVLLSLYMASALSAQSLCILCHWAARAGMAHVSEYSLPPGKPSGHYQRRLDVVLGFAEARQNSYTLRLPGTRRGEACRSIIAIPATPPHEAAAALLATDSSLTIRLSEALDARTLPPAYYSNPVVRNAEGMVMPWGLYMDSVPYSLVDSALGVWLINIISGSRMLLCVLRKALVCSCGCRGWCTYYGLMSWLRWSFETMSHAVWPASRHDSEEWDDQDSERRQKANQAMLMPGILLRIKGDWEEFCQRLGLPTWNSGLRPCFCCVASGEAMYDPLGVSVLGLPWHVRITRQVAHAAKSGWT